MGRTSDGAPRRAILIALGAALFAAGALRVPTAAAAPVTLGHYSISIAPAAAGSTQAIAIKVRNTSLPSSLDVLTSFTVTVRGLSGARAIAGGGFAPSGAGPTFTFAGGSVLPGKTASVAVAGTAPTRAQSFVWSSTAGGLIGGLLNSALAGEANDFAPTSASFNVVPGPATQLVFTTQPSDVRVGAPITPAPQVTVEDQFGNTVSAYGAPVSITSSPTPTADTPDLPAVATPSQGVTTFSDRYIGDAGSGYRLVASSGTLTRTSSTFSVLAADSTTTCEQNATCDSGTVTGQSADTTTDVALGTGSQPDRLTVSVGPQVSPPPVCSNGSDPTTPIDDATQFDNHDAGRSVGVTFRLTNASAFAPPPGFQRFIFVCYESNQTFTGSTATGQGTYFRLLPTCASVGNHIPCGDMVGQVGNVVTFHILAQSGDPTLQFSSILKAV